MKRILVICAIAIAVFVLPLRNIHAIVFIPALILIPIAQIVAVIIGGLSIPIAAVSVFWHSMYKTHPKKLFLIGIGIVIIVSGVSIIVLKLFNPERPLF